MSTVEITQARLRPWIDGFIRRNGQIAAIEQLTMSTDRGGTATISGPLIALPQEQLRTLDQLLESCRPRLNAAVLLLRRGGYSIARVAIDGPQVTVATTKTGGGYVQGRTAAGGQSQQRFARRRDNQATKLVESADRAVRTVFGDQPTNLGLLILGGDTLLIEQLLQSTAAARLRNIPQRITVPIGNPRRRLIEHAVELATSVQVTVHNSDRPE